MKVAAIGILIVLTCSCSQTDSWRDSPPRLQSSQITFGGGIDLDDSLNSIVKKSRNARWRRTRLRPPLWRLYELLKGPGFLCNKTATVAALKNPFGTDKGLADPRLAEMLMLAGIDAVSLSGSAFVGDGNVQRTMAALKGFGIEPLGTASNGGFQVANLNLIDVSAALIGVHVGKGAKTSAGLMTSSIDGVEKTANEIKAARTGAAGKADVLVLVVGWDESLDLTGRQKWAHGIIDAAPVDAILGFRDGDQFEGIEAYKDKVIVYNPGLVLNSKLSEDETSASIIFRLHLSKNGVEWVEAQPITLEKGQSKIGMGTTNTHGTINKLIERSQKLNTKVVNEFGRGIWEKKATAK